MNRRIEVNELKGISIRFLDDLFELAQFMLKVTEAKNRAWDDRDPGIRHTGVPTVNGVISAYARVDIDQSSESIKAIVRERGIDLGAVVEFDHWGEQPFATDTSKPHFPSIISVPIGERIP